MTGLFGTSGRMHHLLTLEHMPRAMLEHLLVRAQDLAADAEGGVARRIAGCGSTTSLMRGRCGWRN